MPWRTTAVVTAPVIALTLATTPTAPAPTDDTPQITTQDQAPEPIPEER